MQPKNFFAAARAALFGHSTNANTPSANVNSSSVSRSVSPSSDVSSDTFNSCDLILVNHRPGSLVHPPLPPSFASDGRALHVPSLGNVIARTPAALRRIDAPVQPVTSAEETPSSYNLRSHRVRIQEEHPAATTSATRGSRQNFAAARPSVNALSIRRTTRRQTTRSARRPAPSAGTTSGIAGRAGLVADCDVEAASYVTLRAMSRNYGLATSGTKAELRQRIRDKLDKARVLDEQTQQLDANGNPMAPRINTVSLSDNSAADKMQTTTSTKRKVEIAAPYVPAPESNVAGPDVTAKSGCVTPAPLILPGNQMLSEPGPSQAMPSVSSTGIGAGPSSPPPPAVVSQGNQGQNRNALPFQGPTLHSLSGPTESVDARGGASMNVDLQIAIRDLISNNRRLSGTEYDAVLKALNENAGNGNVDNNRSARAVPLQVPLTAQKVQLFPSGIGKDERASLLSLPIPHANVSRPSAMVVTRPSASGNVAMSAMRPPQIPLPPPNTPGVTSSSPLVLPSIPRDQPSKGKDVARDQDTNSKEIRDQFHVNVEQTGPIVGRNPGASCDVVGSAPPSQNAPAHGPSTDGATKEEIVPMRDVVPSRVQLNTMAGPSQGNQAQNGALPSVFSGAVGGPAIHNAISAQQPTDRNVLRNIVTGNGVEEDLRDSPDGSSDSEAEKARLRELGYATPQEIMQSFNRFGTTQPEGTPVNPLDIKRDEYLRNRKKSPEPSISDHYRSFLYNPNIKDPIAKRRNAARARDTKRYMKKVEREYRERGRQPFRATVPPVRKTGGHLYDLRMSVEERRDKYLMDRIRDRKTIFPEKPKMDEQAQRILDRFKRLREKTMAEDKKPYNNDLSNFPPPPAKRMRMRGEFTSLVLKTRSPMEDEQAVEATVDPQGSEKIAEDRIEKNLLKEGGKRVSGGSNSKDIDKVEKMETEEEKESRIYNINERLPPCDEVIRYNPPPSRKWPKPTIVRGCGPRRVKVPEDGADQKNLENSSGIKENKTVGFHEEGGGESRIEYGKGNSLSSGKVATDGNDRKIQPVVLYSWKDFPRTQSPFDLLPKISKRSEPGQSANEEKTKSPNISSVPSEEYECPFKYPPPANVNPKKGLAKPKKPFGASASSAPVDAKESIGDVSDVQKETVRKESTGGSKATPLFQPALSQEAKAETSGDIPEGSKPSASLFSVPQSSPASMVFSSLAPPLAPSPSSPLFSSNLKTGDASFAFPSANSSKGEVSTQFVIPSAPVVASKSNELISSSDQDPVIPPISNNPFKLRTTDQDPSTFSKGKEDPFKVVAPSGLAPSSQVPSLPAIASNPFQASIPADQVNIPFTSPNLSVTKPSSFVLPSAGGESSKTKSAFPVSLEIKSGFGSTTSGFPTVGIKSQEKEDIANETNGKSDDGPLGKTSTGQAGSQSLFAVKGDAFGVPNAKNPTGSSKKLDAESTPLPGASVFGAGASPFMPNATPAPPSVTPPLLSSSGFTPASGIAPKVEKAAVTGTIGDATPKLGTSALIPMASSGMPSGSKETTPVVGGSFAGGLGQSGFGLNKGVEKPMDGPFKSSPFSSAVPAQNLSSFVFGAQPNPASKDEKAEAGKEVGNMKPIRPFSFPTTSKPGNLFGSTSPAFAFNASSAAANKTSIFGTPTGGFKNGDGSGPVLGGFGSGSSGMFDAPAPVMPGLAASSPGMAPSGFPNPGTASPFQTPAVSPFNAGSTGAFANGGGRGGAFSMGTTGAKPPQGQRRRLRGRRTLR